MRWASKKNLSLESIYKRMRWDKAKQWRRRKHPDLRFREALLLGVACEAPIGLFLVDLAVALAFSKEGRRETKHQRETLRRRHYARGTCLFCGRSHRTASCPRALSPRAALDLLSADRLIVIGAHTRRLRRVRKAMSE